MSNRDPVGAKANSFPSQAFTHYDDIRQTAATYRKAVSLILALTIAHEMGHVLLPPPAHATVGLMKNPWEPSDVERAAEHRFSFTAAQGQLIRTRLMHCCTERSPTR